MIKDLIELIDYCDKTIFKNYHKAQLLKFDNNFFLATPFLFVKDDPNIKKCFGEVCLKLLKSEINILNHTNNYTRLPKNISFYLENKNGQIIIKYYSEINHLEEQNYQKISDLLIKGPQEECEHIILSNTELKKDNNLFYLLSKKDDDFIYLSQKKGIDYLLSLKTNSTKIMMPKEITEEKNNQRIFFFEDNEPKALIGCEKYSHSEYEKEFG